MLPPGLGGTSWRDGFDARLMVPELHSTDRMGAIKELVNRLYEGGWVSDSLSFMQAVLEREDLESTVVADGVAFPHARCRTVSRLGAAIGVSRRGIDFRTGDAGRVHLVCLFAVPVHESLSYLTMLAETSVRFQEPAFCDRLRESTTSRDMHRFLTRSFAGSSPRPAA